MLYVPNIYFIINKELIQQKIKNKNEYAMFVLWLGWRERGMNEDISNYIRSRENEWE